MLGAALGALALAAWAQPASAQQLSFCPPGEGAGQCGELPFISSFRGLAIDREDGRLYVADEPNHRINVFEEDGDFALAFGWGVADGSPEPQTCGPPAPEADPDPALCRKGIPGEGPGQFDDPTDVAVDNEGADQHALYVVDEGNFRVQRLDPEAGSASEWFEWTVGEKVNVDTEADLCTAGSGDECGAGENSEAEGGFSTSLASSIFVDVGPDGTVHVLDSPRPAGTFEQRLQRFEPSGAIVPPQCFLAAEGGRANGLAVDSGANVWTASGGGSGRARKYDPNCAQLFAGENRPSTSMAVDEEDRAFAAQVDREPVITAFSPAGAILSRFGYGALAVNPEGLAARGGASEWIFASQDTDGIVRLALPDPGPLAIDPEAEPRSVWARIGAQVNPEGEPTDYLIEYIEKAQCEANEAGGGECFDGAVSTGTVALGFEDFTLHPAETIAGCTDFAAEAPSPCLDPETEYRFRFLASNPSGENQAEGEFTTGPPLEIAATYATEAGTEVATLNAEVNPLGSPASGHFEYIAEGAYEANLAAGLPPFEGAVQTPDVEGGEAPLEFGAGEETVRRSAFAFPLTPGGAYRYRFIASDPFATIPGPERRLVTFEAAEPEGCPNAGSRIGAGALLPDCRAYELVSPPDKAGGEIRVFNSGEHGLPAGIEQSTPGGKKLAYSSYRAFGDALSAPYSSQYIARRVAGQEWKTHSVNAPQGTLLSGIVFDQEIAAFSENLCRGWLRTFAEFPPPAPPGYVPGYSNLLRRDDRLCGAEGFTTLAPLSTPPNVETDGFRLTLQGISADGARAIFRATDVLAVGGSPGTSQLYESTGGGLRLLCVLPGEVAHTGDCTAGSSNGGIRLSNTAGALSADGRLIYWSDKASGEGEIYLRVEGSETLEVSAAAEAAEGTTEAWFWGAAEDGSRAIFTTGSHLYSYEPAGKASEKITEGVSGVMGMSDDARRVYFASGKDLTGPEGENSEGDVAVEGEVNLYLHTAGEGGGEIAFVARPGAADFTTAPITPSAIARESGFRNSRVSADGAHAAFLSRASLTGYDTRGASGGAPLPQAYLYDAGSDELLCASCNPSGARAAGAAAIPPFDNALHASRALSADGSRLYFDTADALVPRDTNGRVDAYQWEQAGAGGCDASDPSHSAAAQGCVELISSGTSVLDSHFVEASASGSDVFFTTLTGLLPQDPGLLDLYDAREGGGLPVPSSAPECEGDACQDPAEPPETPTPASSAYHPPTGAPAVAPNPCRRAARRARGASRRAKALRRKARRAARRGNSRGAQRMARRSRRMAGKAKGASRRAKRCRARRGKGKSQRGALR